jgi:hypothetical protein
VKPDRTPLLISASLVIFLLSFFLPLASVHTYCENRTIAAVFGFISIAVFLMLLRNRAASTFKRIVAIIGGALCFLALAVNVAFILYATHECRHMFDQLHP